MQWSSQTTTKTPPIPNPANQQVSSPNMPNGLPSGPYHYSLEKFAVGTTGTYSANIHVTGSVNTAWFLTGTFTPNAAALVTPTSNFFSAFFRNTTPGNDIFTNLNFTAGSTYSVLVAYGSGTFQTDFATISFTGPGIICFGVDSCPVSDNTVINDTTGLTHYQSYSSTVTSATFGYGGTFVATGGAVSPLQVQGPLTLSSGSNLIIAPVRGGYSLGNSNYVITASSVSGTFSNVSSTFSLYPYQVGYTSTGVTVTYLPYSIPNENSAASAVDNSVGLYNLFADPLTGQDLINGLNSISAEPYADNQTVGLQFLRRQSDLLLGSAGDNCQDAKKNYCGFVLGGKNVVV